jgi:hypothetical protein
MVMAHMYKVVLYGVCASIKGGTHLIYMVMAHMYKVVLYGVCASI